MSFVDRAARPFLAAAVIAVIGLPVLGAEAVTFQATYSIMIWGLTIGHAKAEIRIADDRYSAAIGGSITGLLRLFSDARVDLAGSGRVQGNRLVPSSYDYLDAEGGKEWRIRMAMGGGAVLGVVPPAKVHADTVPVTSSDKRNVIDPLTAFLVPIDPRKTLDGQLACNRAVKVFNESGRFHLRLSYKGTRNVEGRGDAYAGDVYVCAVRYVPVAGHREGDKSVRELADNERLEVWLAPLAKTPMLAPYKIVIGDTQFGDVTILSTRFVVAPHKASAH